VAFHAHPDDESLITGGTLARCASEGHRVVLVLATAGDRGLAVDAADLGERRMTEARRAAAALGVARVVFLGYADSGFDDVETPPAGSFCAVPTAEAAQLLAAILVEEKADVLTVYDARGGYGHRDHIKVHEVGLAAARAAATPVVLAATVDRAALLRGLRLLRRLGVRPGGMTPEALATAFTSAREITHVVDVRRHLVAKRRALHAHASQTTGGADVRTVRLLARLPWPLSRWVLGREWFVEVGRTPTDPRLDDVFATLRDR
jgi:LmbE family N-acetylglucosaminyl deacetylase